MKRKFRVDISLPVDRLFFDLMVSLDSTNMDADLFHRALEADAKLAPLDIWIEENLEAMLLGNRFGTVVPALPPSFRISIHDNIEKNEPVPAFPEYATRWLTNPDSLHASILQALSDRTEDIEQV